MIGGSRFARFNNPLQKKSVAGSIFAARVMKYRILLSAVLLFFASGAGAQQELTATASAIDIGRNDFVEVKFTVQNAKDVRHITPPSFVHFKVIGGPVHESNTTNFNGIQTSSEGISYTLQPLTPGIFILPPATAEADGKKLSSNLLKLIVRKNPASSKNQASTLPGFFPGISPFDEPAQPEEYKDNILKMGEDPQEKINRNLFVRIELDKKSCYVGEPVLATCKLYTRLKSESNMVKSPSFNGVSVTDLVTLGNNFPQKETLNGREYNVYIIRKSQLYPLQPGLIELQPAEIENKVHFIKDKYIRDNSQLWDEFFNDPGSLTIPTDALVDIKITTRSKPIQIQVNPLPDKNKPVSFKGAVGKFIIQAALEKNIFSTDESGKLRIILSGEGNLHLVNSPVVIWPVGTDTYEAITEEMLNRQTVPVSGQKQIDYPFTVSLPGTYTIPGIHFPFFNNHTGKYETVFTQPLVFTVTKGSGIRKDTLAAEAKDERFFNSFFNDRKRIAGIVAILIIIGLFWWVRSEQKKERKFLQEKEKGSVETLPVVKETIYNPLTSLEDLMEKNDSAGFYSQLNISLKEFLSQLMNCTPVDLNRKSLSAILDQRGFPVKDALQLLELLDEIEQKVYTPQHGDVGMHGIYEKAYYLVKQLQSLC